MDEETKYWMAFSLFPGIGPMRFSLLLEYFGSAKSAWFASESELEKINLGSMLIRRFCDFRKHTDIGEYCRAVREKHIHVLARYDPHYPENLKNIIDPPIVLYVLGKRGEKPLDFSRAVGVVGTRQVTEYGRQMTETIVRDLVSYGCLIVSGMAYGVDAIAHQAALESGGSTVAVLGCGIDIAAPACNAVLYRKIAQSGRGAVAGEMPLGLRPEKGLFVQRNRIISGMCRGIVVTEGADDSGTLITARYAANQGREVFAVPGPVTSRYSAGPARLIKSGATLVERASDIALALGFA